MRMQLFLLIGGWFLLSGTCSMVWGADLKKSTTSVGTGDWAQWGGSSTRNNTPSGTNVPTEFEAVIDAKTNQLVAAKSKNIKWAARLGSQSYGNPVVANGKIYVGTNNGGGYLKRYPFKVDLGCMLCFSEKDGKFLWQHSCEKLSTGRVHDWPHQGICSTPLVEGDRLWFVTNRGEVVCADTEGFLDGEDDGPVTGEWLKEFELIKPDDAAKDRLAAATKEFEKGKIAQAALDKLKDAATDRQTPALEALKGGKLTPELAQAFGQVGLTVPADTAVKEEEPAKRWSFAVGKEKQAEKYEFRMEGPKLVAYKQTSLADTQESDVVWRLNMMKELGISQHNMCSCSVTAAGDYLFVNTSNGVDEGHAILPAPAAPTFVCLNKNTGKVIWTDNSPGDRVLHGQWSSPSYGVIKGRPQVLFGGGDGWLYSFDPAGDGKGHSKLWWKFDCNPKTSKFALAGKDVTRNHLIGTPVIVNDLVYLGVGEDPEHGEAPGHLWCIDPTKDGDVSPELAFKLPDLEHPIPHTRRVQAVDEKAGEVAKPNPNSAVVWHYIGDDLNGNGEIDFEEMMHRTCGTVVIKDGILVIPDFCGVLHCLDAKTGKAFWTYDMSAESWGSACIVEDKIYVGDSEADISIFKLSKTMELIGEANLGAQVYSTPIVANNVMYIANQQWLFAIEADKK